MEEGSPRRPYPPGEARQASRVDVARPAVELVHCQEEGEERGKKHILQETPWVLRN